MRYPNAQWIGPTPNETVGGMVEVRGLVLHIQEGNETGSESWFQNPAAQASSHFLNPKTGPLRQMVDTRDKAWAEAAGNAHWVSVEDEGYSGESLTQSQINNLVGLYSWLNQVYGIPFEATDDPNGNGLGWHGMGGAAWGGHYDCPGEPVKSQRETILNSAAGIQVSTAGAPWPGVYLSKTNSGGHYDSRVAHYQQTMANRGWTIGVDGWFGDQTDRVTRAFQQEKGLTVDGIVGRQTWDAAENLPVT